LSYIKTKSNFYFLSRSYAFLLLMIKTILIIIVLVDYSLLFTGSWYVVATYGKHQLAAK